MAAALGELVVSLSANIAQFTAAMTKAEYEATQRSKRMEQAFNSASKALAGIGVTVAAGAWARALVQTADEMTNLESRIKLVTASTSELATVQARLFAQSQASQTSLRSNADLYVGLARSTSELGVSQERLLTMTDRISKAFVVSGTGAQQQAATILQLGQAFASGKLGGDEFKSVAETAPRLMDALAAGLGVARGALKDMAAEGKLTTDVVFPALEKGLESIEGEFAQLAPTVSRASQAISNAFDRWVGDANKASGVNAALAGGLTAVANNFDAIATGVGVVAVAAIGRYAGIAGQATAATIADLAAKQQALAVNEALAAGELRRAEANKVSAVAELDRARAATAAAQAQVAADRERLASQVLLLRSEIELERARVGVQAAAGGRAASEARLAALSAELVAAEAALAKTESQLGAVREAQTVATNGAAAATLRYSEAQVAAGAATAAASRGIGVASGALTLLGGPLGAIITALGVGAIAWASFGSAGQTNMEKIASAAENARKRVAELNKEAKFGSGELGAARAQLAAAQAKLGDFESVPNLSQQGQARKSELAAQVADMEAYVAKLEQAQADATNKAAGFGATVSEKWTGLLQTQAQKRAEAIAKLDAAYADETRKFAGNQEKQLALAAEYQQKRQVLEEQFATKGGGGRPKAAAQDEFLKVMDRVSAKSAGLSASFERDLDTLYAGWQKGRIGAEEYARAVEQLIQEQPFSRDLERQAEEAARAEQQRQQELDSLRRSLMSEEEAIRDSYERRRALVMENTPEGSQQQTDLLGQVEADYQATIARMNQQGRDQLYQGLLTEEEALIQSYQRRHDAIMESTLVTEQERQDLLMRLQQDHDEKMLEINGGFWEQWLAAAEKNLTSMDELSGQLLEQTSQRFGDLFESIIFDSESASDAILKFAEGMLRTIVNALGQMAAQWLIYKAVQSTVGKAAANPGAAAMSANAQASVYMAGLNAYAATAAIPIVGPGLAPAAMAAAIAATEPLAAGVSFAASAGAASSFAGAFDSGGDIAAGKWGIVGEHGLEIVHGPASVTGRQDTANMIRDLAGREVGRESPSVNVKNVVLMDTDAVIGNYLGGAKGDQVFVTLAGRNPEALRRAGAR